MDGKRPTSIVSLSLYSAARFHNQTMLRLDEISKVSGVAATTISSHFKQYSAALFKTVSAKKRLNADNDFPPGF